MQTLVRLYEDELAMLRRVSPSQGMMLESLRDDLECHRGAPDKEPQRRIDTLCLSGELAIPFTSGILVGIGEERRDRIDALALLAAAHAKYGNVQEVIVQNFLPKAGTAMHKAKPCPEDEYLWSIAVARLILAFKHSLASTTELCPTTLAYCSMPVSTTGAASPLSLPTM